MSDLRTEIVSKVLNSWEHPITEQLAPIPAELTIAESIFNFIHAHPSCTSNDVVDNTNVDLGRASATLLALYQKGKVDRKKYPNPKPDGKRDNVYMYWTTVDSYKEKGVPRLMKPKKQKKPYIHKALNNLEAPKPVYQMPRMKQVVEEIRDLEVTNKQFVAEDFIEKLSVTQAKAVYLALKNIFDSRLHG